LVSRGRLMRHELADISSDDKLSSFTVDRAVTRVRRFIIGEPTSGYALCHPRFQGYLASTAISESDQRRYRDWLLRWCEAWRSPPPKRYAFARYVTHLVERLTGAPMAERKAETEGLLSLTNDPHFQSQH